MSSAAATPADGLLWAFHAGFADYIARLADGRVTVTDGAELHADGRVLFPTAPVPSEVTGDSTGTEVLGTCGDVTVLWRGTGTLQFTGHHGLLAVTLAEPAMVHAGDRYLITVDDPFEPGQRMPLADLGSALDTTSFDAAALDTDSAALPNRLSTARPAARPTPLHVAEPRLTEEGADLFFGHYHRGTPLAPLDLSADHRLTAAVERTVPAGVVPTG